MQEQEKMLLLKNIEKVKEIEKEIITALNTAKVSKDEDLNLTIKNLYDLDDEKLKDFFMRLFKIKLMETLLENKNIFFEKNIKELKKVEEAYKVFTNLALNVDKVDKITLYKVSKLINDKDTRKALLEYEKALAKYVKRYDIDKVFLSYKSIDEFNEKFKKEYLRKIDELLNKQTSSERKLTAHLIYILDSHLNALKKVNEKDLLFGGLASFAFSYYFLYNFARTALGILKEKESYRYLTLKEELIKLTKMYKKLEETSTLDRITFNSLNEELAKSLLKVKGYYLDSRDIIKIDEKALSFISDKKLRREIKQVLELEANRTYEKIKKDIKEKGEVSPLINPSVFLLYRLSYELPDVESLYLDFKNSQKDDKISQEEKKEKKQVVRRKK